jgi:release factor glutamine methyltransferase
LGFEFKFADMTIQEASQQLVQQLATIYDMREATNIADWVLEHLTGWKKVDRLIHKQDLLDAEKQLTLERYTRELLMHKPVQYVLNEAWFCGMKLYVNENVLIPRPETEELVEWIEKLPGKKILDVGTGSGCIPIALKKKLPAAEVYACDVSEKALQVARRNAEGQETAIQFMHLDFLDANARQSIPQVDILVSNPPYVPLKDKNTMQPNVLQYEPHLALFVQDDDPLIFYKALADFAQTRLLPDGTIYAEIHEDLGSSVKELFQAKGFAHTELRKDMQGKYRMIRAAKT